MRGRLFELWGTVAPSYFVLLVAGFLFATLAGALWARRVGHNPDVIVDLGLSMLVFGVLGGRLLHVVADGHFWDYVHLCTDPSLVEWKISQAECLHTNDPGAIGSFLGESVEPLGRWDASAQVCRPLEADCFAWARFWAGGLTYYGGFMGASIAAWFLLRSDRFPFWKAADMAGLVVPLGITFGRLGCLLGGCCFGRPWDSPLAIRFPPGSPASAAQASLGQLQSEFMTSLPVHPTQLYESLGCFVLALFLLIRVHPRKHYDGQVFLGFVCGYAALRFVLEYFRADERGALGWFSTSQWVGLCLLGVGWWVHGHLTGQGTGSPSSAADHVDLS